jgi:AcrR family transcriptional regulator
MSAENRPTRTYRSPLRAEQAAATRTAIITAAAEVFAERSYVGATLPQIAAAAGVSVESVNKVGPKSALLILAFKQAYAGESGWRTILDEPDLLRIMSIEDTSEAIAGYAQFIAEANVRTAGIWPAVRAAALSEPQVAAQIDELIALKREDFLMGIGWYIGRGVVPAETAPAAAAPYLYVLTSQETFAQLMGDWGYTIESYTTWLTEAIMMLGTTTSKLPPATLST